MSLDGIRPPHLPSQPNKPPSRRIRYDEYLQGARRQPPSGDTYPRTKKEPVHDQAAAPRKIKKQRIYRVRFSKVISRLAAFRPRGKKTPLIVVSLVILVAVLFFVLPRFSSKAPSAQVLNNQQDAPTFEVLTPNDDITLTTSGDLGFDKEKQVASFTDAIGDIPITISQQPLPEKFQQDPQGELSTFAEQINAKEKLDIHGTAAYSGLSAKGPQTIVCIKNQLLIFITADREVPDTELFSYIESLK